jgi:predicted glycosyltransferase
MTILFDLLHPAHVHVFRNAIFELQQKGHKVIVTSREKDHTVFLLNKYGIQHECLSTIASNKVGLLFEFMIRAAKLINICRREKPDLMVGIMGAIIAPVGKLMGIPSHTYYDTEMATLTNQYVYKLTTKFITPKCYTDKVPEAIHVSYNGYHELAYLHPKRFVPNPDVLSEIGLKEGDTFFVMRFVSWAASHDIGQAGLSLEMKKQLVEILSEKGKVIITSEKELPEFFEPYRMSVSPEKIHHLLYYATMLYGESATMASEAAVLGTHAFFIDNLGRGYTTEEEEKYQLVFNFKNDAASVAQSVEKVKELLADNNLVNSGRQKRERMLAGTIDLTDFIVQSCLAVKH